LGLVFIFNEMQMLPEEVVRKFSVTEFEDFVTPWLRSGRTTDADLRWIKNTRRKVRNREYAIAVRSERRKQEIQLIQELDLLRTIIHEQQLLLESRPRPCWCMARFELHDKNE
jgi:hypothetical protein